MNHFKQIHIDVARNATDDFNLFHDSISWNRIHHNPFQGAIALGFQIESLIENKILGHRKANQEDRFISEQKLNFSNYQFSFANAIKPGQLITVDIRNSQIKAQLNPVISNRISVKADNKLALIGYKKESREPLFLQQISYMGRDINLKACADRSFVDLVIETVDGEIKQEQYFLKRKYMNVSNAKNFLCGSLVDQRMFFDELKNRYQFPEIFPCAFISCALLEKSLLDGLDFEKEPMVYSSHKISIDRSLLKHLKSNEALHILVKQDLLNSNSEKVSYECYGLISHNQILYRALVELTPLAAILDALKDKESTD